MSNLTVDETATQKFVHESLYGLRSLFYLLTPNETYYADAKDVPDLTTDVCNFV